MYYGITRLATDWTEEMMHGWKVRLLRAVFFFIPRANPDVENFYPRVKGWALEVADSGMPQREVGLDEDGRPLFATPNDTNTGFWTDMAAMEFSRDDLEAMDADEFERLWSLGGGTGA